MAQKKAFGWVLIVVAVLGFLLYFAAENSATSGHPVEAKAVDSTEPVIRISSVRLAAAYHANELQADHDFKGRHLLVAGRVRSINKDLLGDANLELAGSDGFSSVVASLRKIDEPWARRLHRGDAVILYCSGDGMMVSSPMLSGCTQGWD